MKKRSLTYFGLLLLSMLVGIQTFAQTNVNHPNSGTGAFTTTLTPGAFVNYYDQGGPAGTYLVNNNNTTASQTFAPSNPATQKVVVRFSEFQTETAWDGMFVYDGSSTAATQISSGIASPWNLPFGAWSGAGVGASPRGGLVDANNPNGSLTFSFFSDASVVQAGWAACVTEINNSLSLTTPCTVNAPPDQLNLSTDATSCTATMTTAVATASCSTVPGIQMTYSVDGGTPVVLNQPFPPTVTIPNLGAGNHTITWVFGIQTACGTINFGSDNQAVFVQDLVPPVLTCPGDITLNLAPGACSAFYSYNVIATDNCPFLVPVTLTQNPPSNNPAQPIDAAQSLNCGFAQTKFGRVFGGPGTGPYTINTIETGIRATGAGAYSFRIYELTSGTTPAAGNANFNPLMPAFNMNMPNVTTTYVPVNLPAPVTIPAGSYFFVEIISQLGNYTMGNIAQADLPGQTSYIASTACGLPDYMSFASVGFPGLSLAFNLIGIEGGEPEIIQISGLPSGSEFNVGTTTNCFEVFDVQGNRGECCFDVTVAEYPNATQSLVCNDNVQISLDQQCEAVVGADDILEGGPYGCYDTRYTVMVLSPLGGNLGNTVNASFIGKTWTVKVIDNQTGQSCWGSIKVEDKLPPVIECSDITVECTADLSDPAINQPFPAFFDPQPAFYTPSGPPLTYPGGFWVYAFGPEDGIFFDIENVTNIPVAIDGVSLSFNGNTATTLSVYVTNTANTYVGNTLNPAAWDDIIVDKPTMGAGLGVEVQVPFDGPTIVLQPGERRGMFVYSFGIEFVFTNGGGTFTNGDLQVIANPGVVVGGRFANGLGAFQPYQPVMSFSYGTQQQQVDPSDNCNLVSVLAESSFVDMACGGPAGQTTRTWTATDAQGNKSTCTQVITLDRPNLSDVDVPNNIKWTCTQYDIFPNIIDPIAVHPFITDCDDATEILDATCYDASCDDLDFATQDNAGTNSTTNGGGCPGFGLDDADVLALTGSGYPHIDGRPLISICEIGVEHEDIVVQECVGSFKIVRQWTLIDWCSNPVQVRQENQVIKVVDEEAPVIELFGVDGNIVSNYGNSQIPALGNLGNPNTTGGCGQAPQNTGGTVYTALVQLPGTGGQFNPDQFTNISLQSVLLTINHQHVEDLDIFLKGPSNKVIELTTDNGANGVGYHRTKFVDDPNAPLISTANSPFTGKYRPEGTQAISCGGFNGNVATLAEMTSNWQADVLGTWELIVFDDDQNNIGEMVEWKLNFSFGDVTIDVYNSTATGSIHTVCQGSVLLPPIQDCLDNCSGVQSYTTELWTRNAQGNPVFQIGTINGNGGYFHNVPMFENGLPARYVVRYTATDGCKNQASVLMQIRLRDKVPPVVVCDEITEVAITNNGQGTGSSCSKLWADKLDDGSYDNCTPVYFLMAKMDDATATQDIYNRCYYPSRDFCCDDVGDNTVIVLVLDQDPTPLFNTTITTPAFGCHLPTPNTPSLFLPPNGLNFTVPGTGQLVPVNFNTCMVTVQVTDKLPPVLVNCPANERISCDLYASNFETQLANAANATEQCSILGAQFGNATFFDNCVANVNCTVTFNLDQCLEGTIRRTWTATDGAGNTNSSQNCNQTIFVDHVSDFVVEFPQHRNGASGHLPPVECGADVPDFGEPEIFYETCELIAVSYDDEVFTDEPGACYKIVRQWTVINWCVVGSLIDQEVVEESELAMRLSGCLSIVNLECDLDGDGDCDDRTFRDSWRSCNLPDAAHATQSLNPDTDPDSDPWDGYITYQQVIKVNDTVNPVFTNGCQIPDVCITNNTCVATVLLPTPDIDECSEHVDFTYRINIGGTWLNGAGPFLNVAPGQYPVRYVASDNCNNQTACETVLNVVDCKKPTPYCKTGIVVELMVVDPAMVEVWASDLNDNSFDNCPGALKYSFSANVNDLGRTYTCDNLGQNTVEIWVTDAAGNQDFCITNIFIQANMGQCDDDPLVAGQTATEQGQGVQDVTVNINSPSGFDANVATNVSGTFTQGVVNGGDYSITPVHDVDPLNGVTTYDLVVISKHILGVDPLDSPYQIIAADANKSNTVTTFDLVELRKLILFINTEFPNNTSWRFVDKGFVFANPANPFASSFPEVINLNNVTNAQLNNNFVAIKVGDVNGSAAVNLASAEDRTMVGDLVLNTDDAVLAKGDVYTVEFKATDFAVSGYQFTLNFDNDALSFEGIVPGLADASNFGLTMVNEGTITTSWNSNEVKALATGETVFSLTFTAKQDGRLSDMLNINSRYTVAEAYTAGAELLNVALSFNNALVADGFELYQNTPNPFGTTTTIGFHLPEATSATLTISDVQGKVVKVVNREFAKGYNQVELKRSDLGATGVLYYRLDTGADSATRMMILVD